ncbi:hypothetical protein F8388_003232 [Cannabis sativa]|uniref:Pleiotropic ABC efflux transporter N-terminal domain-containing protein n=1 Tax=Cannabis sativa TaxID=3483 RepID=A0A7J6FLP1_CANSA|nr:hypothetical protein F8388_003232 [Cannabis sativa]
MNDLIFVIFEISLPTESIATLPSQKCSNFALLRKSPSGKACAETIDVTKLDRQGRENLVKKVLATNDQDNNKLLSAIKERLDRVGIKVPNVEVQFENLNVVSKVQTGSRALPTLINFSRNAIEYLDLFENVSGKTTLFNYSKRHQGGCEARKDDSALRASKLGQIYSTFSSGSDLKKSGKITYNGELTVIETLDFAARCQGASEGFGCLFSHC